MKTSKKKKADGPDKEWLFESPEADAARTRTILDTIPDDVVPERIPKDVDANGLAMLPGPIDAAWRRLKEADRKFKLPRLEAMAAEADASPQLAAEAREPLEKYLAENSVPVQKAIKLITRREKWDDAKSWWERFWATKVKREGKPKEWLEAKLIQYRNPKKKLTLAEVEKLRQEFDQLSEYRGQGKVLSPSDGRLKVTRAKKLAKLQKVQESKRPRGKPKTKVKLMFTDNIEKLQAIKAAAETGKTLTQASAY